MDVVQQRFLDSCNVPRIAIATAGKERRVEVASCVRIGGCLNKGRLSTTYRLPHGQQADWKSLYDKRLQPMILSPLLAISLDWIGNAFFGLFFPILAIYAGYLVRKAWRLGVASEHWPSVSGTIVSSEMECEEHDDPDTYRLLVQYTYEVQGEMHTGDTLTYRGTSTKRQHVAAHLAKYPAGCQVPVFYDPEAPEQSVLEPGVDTKNYRIAVAVLSILFLIGLVMLTWTIIDLVGFAP